MTQTQYPSDTFTETDVINCLQAAGKKFKNGSRYLLVQCPLHDDDNPSAQIYKDDWFVNCNAGCGRYHITKPYPELRRRDVSTHEGALEKNGSLSTRTLNSKSKVQDSLVSEHKYTTYDLMEDWKKMPLIPRNHTFKNIPLEVLDELGWRMDSERNAYFIPYFSRSKTSIPFAQYRNLSSSPRFNMLKNAKPTCYGTWNLLPGEKLFLVEGTSDCAVLEACLVPWIGVPSAASKELVGSLARWCIENALELIYAGDNDDAGDALRLVLEGTMPHRVKQPPKKYKDWGDFYEAEGSEAVSKYCFEELFPKASELSFDNVFPGAEEVPITSADTAGSKERTVSAQLF